MRIGAEYQLSRLYWVNKSIESKQEELARRYAMGTQCTSRTDTEPVEGGGQGGTKIERAVEGMDLIQRQIEAEIQKAYALRREAMELINRVDDSKLRLILELKYIQGKTIEQIAEIIGYDYRWTRRLKKRALEEVESKLAPQSPIKTC